MVNNRPTVYNASSVYKTGAGGGSIVSPIKFYTIGNQEQDNKDKPIIGGLTDLTFNGETFFKTIVSDKNFFNVTPRPNEEQTDTLHWVGGIGDDRPAIGKSYYTCFDYLITFDSSHSYRPMSLSLFNRKIECGLENGKSRGISIGCAANNVTVNYTTLSKIDGLSPTDWKYNALDNSVYDNTIHKIECILDYLDPNSGKNHRCKYFIDGTLVLDMSFNGNADTWPINDIRTVGNYRLIRFADIKIIDLTTN